MAKRRYATKKHSKRNSKRAHRHRTYRRRGGRGYTTGASATLAQMAPAPFSRLIGAGLAFMSGGSSRK